MMKRAADFLGTQRLQALFLLLAGTGLASLILNGVEGDWVRPVQSLLALACIVGGGIIVATRFEREVQARLLALTIPALGLVLLGLFAMPQYFGVFVGGAVGWVVAGMLVFRPRIPMQYYAAVKHLRKNEYADAVKVMDAVIKDEPDKPEHYRFRAEVLRVWGKLDRARRDYQKMTELEPDSAVAYNGLAEVNLQSGNFPAALQAAQRAHELAPDEWVAAYNLGMIEDRLKHSPQVIEHLNKALALRIPDARHRVLIHLYLARAYTRQGDVDAAAKEVEALRRERNGLKEWQTLLASDQAETLRAAIGADVKAAESLVEGQMAVAELAGSK